MSNGFKISLSKVPAFQEAHKLEGLNERFIRHFLIFLFSFFVPSLLGMATSRVRAGFLHTRPQPVGQDLRPEPGPIINRVFFGAQTRPVGPRQPRLTTWAQIWPNHFF